MKINPILILLAGMLILLIGISPLLLEGRTAALGRLQVLNVKVDVQPKVFRGACPHRFEFTGYIQVNQRGKVQYQWIRSDGANGPVQTIMFNGPGFKKVSTYWQLGGEGKTYKNYWQVLKVLYPNTVTSERAYFSLYCQPQSGTAITTTQVHTVQTALPDRFKLHFSDAYLVFVPGKKTLQVIAQGNVLCYGEGLSVAAVKPYLFDIRHKFWKKFYWRVNTSRREVYRMRGTNYGRIGDSPAATIRGIRVETVGNPDSPSRFLLKFGQSFLEYVPKNKEIHFTVAGNILHRGREWQKCHRSPTLYHLKHKVWKGFYWQIDTKRRELSRITGGNFCKPGGEATRLKVKVEVKK
jgi:hypothetical protein